MSWNPALEPGCPDAVGLDAIETLIVPRARDIDGFGSMVRQAVEDARRDGISIGPLCPFAKAQIDRHPKWQDVLQRSQVGARWAGNDF